MKWIGIILLIAVLVYSCEKQVNDLPINQNTANGVAQVQTVNIPIGERPYYYKDSVREAFLLRAKKVISKYSGLKLIDAQLIKEEANLNCKKPVIVNIRNVRDSLFVVVKFSSKNSSKMLYGIESPKENTINFLSKTYSIISENTPRCYWVRYCVLKRKSSRLTFFFEGEPIAFHNDL